jgi:heavy metal sensor kinase
MRRLSIRWRLTLWYGAVLAAVLTAFGGAVYLMMRHGLLARTDAELEGELQEMIDDVETTADWPELVRRWSRRFARHGGYEFQVSGVSGRTLVRSDHLGSHRLPVPSIPSSLRHLDFESVPLGARSVDLGPQGRWRVAAHLVPGPGGPVVVQVAATLASVDHELAELLAVLLLTGPLSLAGALGGGYLLARTALAPVDRMAAAAGQITATRLDRRLEVPNPDDELGRLARTLNGMIARLERSFGEIRRFTADAAHELRTPLAVMRNAAEVALRVPREAEEYRRVLEELLEEIERLTRLAEQLLFLCRGDAGLVPQARQSVRLDELVHEVADHMRVVAAVKRQTITVDIPAPCPVAGDADQLRRLLFNLLDNAIKYTPVGGAITVRSQCLSEQVRVVVADDGNGIAAEHLPHIFDRFYRVDPARGQEATDGIGLGLAICRSGGSPAARRCDRTKNIRGCFAASQMRTLADGWCLTVISRPLGVTPDGVGKDLIHEAHASDLGGVPCARSPGGGWAAGPPGRTRDTGAGVPVRPRGGRGRSCVL